MKLTRNYSAYSTSRSPSAGSRNLVTSTLFLCLLSGCGFHLRGQMDLPPWLNHVAIILQQGHRDLTPLLKNQLEAYHLSVTDSPLQATYWLVIEHDAISQNITSISSSTTPRQYQLLYTVTFKLQRANKEDILPSSRIEVTRQVTINSDRILGSNQEEALLEAEMRQDAVLQIMNRISRTTAMHHAPSLR